VPWVWGLVAGLSPWRPVFNPRPVGVGFVALKAALRRDFLRVLQFSLSVSFHRCSVLFSVIITYWINPWSTVLLEKLTGFQLGKKSPAFYGTRRFITAFTRGRRLSLSWASLIQSIPSHSTFWRSLLITFMFILCILNNKLIYTNISTNKYCKLY